MHSMLKGKKVDAVTYIFNNYEEIKCIKERFNEYYVKVNLIWDLYFKEQKLRIMALLIIRWATKNEVLEY